MKKKHLIFYFLTISFFSFFSCSGLMDPDEPGNLVPKTVSEDPSLPQLNITSTTLHLETKGEVNNSILIFLHSGPGRDYRSMTKLETLADDGYFLIFYDQRGTGLSKRHDKNQITMEDYIEDLNRIIITYNTQPGVSVYLIGHGWGAMLATAYINTYPGKIEGAVLCDPYAFTGEYLESIRDNLFDLNLSSEWYNDYIWNSTMMSADSHERKDYQFYLYIKDSRPLLGDNEDDPSPLWRPGAVANEAINESLQDSDGKFNFDFTANLQSYQKDVFFVRSEFNKILDESHHLKLMEYYPKSTLVTANDAAHDIFWSNPIELTDIINSYLRIDAAAQKGGNK
ncbi:alpha/beta fold hydrolase [candidate division KSB1 bacterium]